MQITITKVNIQLHFIGHTTGKAMRIRTKDIVSLVRCISIA